MRQVRHLYVLALLACQAMSGQDAPVEGAINARLLRQPDVSATQIAFVYAGDIWLAPKSGGSSTPRNSGTSASQRAARE